MGRIGTLPGWVLVAWALAAISAVAAPSVERRVALVIGNGAYVNAPALANPRSDADLMATTLSGLGFEVIKGIDLDKTSLDQKIREFAHALTTADTAVFYYAGHGLQVSGENYLIPIDAKLDAERDLPFEAVRADIVLRQMELERESKTNIVFLDACRNNPLRRNLARSMGTRSVSLGPGLVPVQSGVGTFVAFSTQPGNEALDGSGKNSPFTEALARHIKAAGRTLSGVMIEVRKDVLASTDGKQIPWDHSALTGEFYFVPQADVVAAAPTAPANAQEIAALTERMKTLEDELKRTSVSTPAAAASSPRVPAEAPGNCIRVGRDLAGPIAVEAGSLLCAEGGQGKATIKSVHNRAVVYVVAGRETTCQSRDICQFDWPGAPIFRVQTTIDATTNRVRAELVPRN